LIEALALGTPVVATDCPGGSAEILEHGRWGKLVPPEDESALADAIEGAVQEGRRTPDEAIVRFDAGTVIGQYEEILLGNLRAGKDND